MVNGVQSHYGNKSLSMSVRELYRGRMTYHSYVAMGSTIPDQGPRLNTKTRSKLKHSSLSAPRQQVCS